MATVEAPTTPVSRAEAEVRRLHERSAALELEISILRGEIPALESAHQVAVIRDADDAHERRQAVAQARGRLADLVDALTILRSGIRQAEIDLAIARDSRSERERLHWQEVSRTLPDGPEKWVCRIRGWARPGVMIGWDPKDGRQPTGPERVALAAELSRRFPFVDPLEPAPKGKK